MTELELGSITVAEQEVIVEELEAIITSWWSHKAANSNSQDSVLKARINVRFDFGDGGESTFEIHDPTAYRREWNVIDRNLRQCTLKEILWKFLGRENTLVPLKDLDRKSTHPQDDASRINKHLIRISRLAGSDFTWTMTYYPGNQTFLLTT